MNNINPANRGWVKGLSMWPNLIPFDILSSKYVAARDLKPGMIVVFPNKYGSGFHVHRILSIRNFPSGIVVKSCGDSSGIDEDFLIMNHQGMIRIVNGVLRAGRYRLVSSFVIPCFSMREALVTLYNRIVRRIFW